MSEVSQDIKATWDAIEQDCRRMERMPTDKEIAALCDVAAKRATEAQDAEIARLKALIKEAVGHFDEISYQAGRALGKMDKEL
jgi:predicted hydrocarbon binding protein